MRLTTERLDMVPVDPIRDVVPLLEVFNSNPDFLEATEQFSRKRQNTADDVKAFCWQESRRVNGHCLAILVRDRHELVGTTALLVPNPEDETPWIGLLLMTGRHQGEGLGREALGALEDRVPADGWRQLTLAVMQDSPRAKRFWMRAGYRALREDFDHAGRAVLVMEKDLTGSSPVASASAV